MNILHCGPLRRREGGAGKGLCPQLEDKGRGNPSDNPVSKSRPSGTGRERATLGQQRCSPHRSGRSNERVRLMRALKSAGAARWRGRDPHPCVGSAGQGGLSPKEAVGGEGDFSALLLRPRGRADSRGASSLEEKHHSSLPFFFLKSFWAPRDSRSFGLILLPVYPGEREGEEQERGREERRGQC